MYVASASSHGTYYVLVSFFIYHLEIIPMECELSELWATEY